MQLLDGAALSQEILARLAEQVKTLAHKPRLTAVLVGDDPASLTFLALKQKAAEKIGISFHELRYSETISASDLSLRLNQTVKRGHADGILVQLPLPPVLDKNRHGILRIIPEELDVDCLSERWHGRLATGRTSLRLAHGAAELLPPVAATMLRFLEHYHVSVKGRHAVVAGWGDLVGKAVVPVLLRAGATVSVATETEKNLAVLTRQADILVSGIGKPRFITGDMVGEGVTIIDTGASLVGGAHVGDVDFESVAKKAAYLSPVPGGVGPMTVAYLLSNLVALAQARHGFLNL